MAKTRNKPNDKLVPIGPRCECGYRNRPITLPIYDFTAMGGLPAMLEGVPAWRCDNCDFEQPRWDAMSNALFFLEMDIAGLPYRLPAVFATKLRSALGLTQQELADRMGIARETVASWESERKEISPQHDFILRMLAVNQPPQSPSLTPAVVDPVRREVLAKLTAVRTESPPRKLPVLRVPAARFAHLPESQIYVPKSKLRAAYPERKARRVA